MLQIFSASPINNGLDTRGFRALFNPTFDILVLDLIGFVNKNPKFDRLVAIMSDSSPALQAHLQSLCVRGLCHQTWGLQMTSLLCDVTFPRLRTCHLQNQPWLTAWFGERCEMWKLSIPVAVPWRCIETERSDGIKIVSQFTVPLSTEVEERMAEKERVVRAIEENAEGGLVRRDTRSLPHGSGVRR
jgi:hypothetical protein